MAQRVKTLANQPDDLSLISKTHMVERENQFSQLSSDLHIHVVVSTYTHSNCFKELGCQAMSLREQTLGDLGQVSRYLRVLTLVVQIGSQVSVHREWRFSSSPSISWLSIAPTAAHSTPGYPSLFSSTLTRSCV